MYSSVSPSKRNLGPSRRETLWVRTGSFISIKSNKGEIETSGGSGALGEDGVGYTVYASVRQKHLKETSVDNDFILLHH